jgi:hypothetical protein
MGFHIGLQENSTVYFSILASENGILHDVKQQEDAIARVSQDSQGTLDVEAWKDHLRCLINPAANRALRAAGLLLTSNIDGHEEKWQASLAASSTEVPSFLRSLSFSRRTSVSEDLYFGPLQTMDHSAAINVRTDWDPRNEYQLPGQEND